MKKTLTVLWIVLTTIFLVIILASPAVFATPVVPTGFNIEIYSNNIVEVEIKLYSILSGLRVFDDTGYVSIKTNDGQKIILRDIIECSNLEIVINRLKNINIKEKRL